MPENCFSPADIATLVAVDSPVLSPAGDRVAYVVTTVDHPDNKYRKALWLSATEPGAVPRQLTSGQHNDAQPVWSPDGSRLAFVSSGRGGGKHSLHVLPVTGPGEILTVATRDEAFEAITFSPTGDRLLFASRVREAPLPAAAADQPARRILGLGSRTDNIGWVVDRPRQVFVVSANGSGAPRRLTFGQQESYDPCFAPDGRHIAYVTARHHDADLDKVGDIWLLSLADPQAEAERLTDTDAVFRLPSFKPDGSALAFFQSRGPDGGRMGYRHQALAVLSLADRSRTVRSAGLDRNLMAGTPKRPLWQGDSLVVAAEDRGTVPVLRIAADGAVTRLADGPRTITGFDATADGALLALVSNSLDRGGEIHLCADGSERQLSHHQPERAALPAHRFTVSSEDGCELDAWLLLPPGTPADAPAASIPLLLSIHGGPAAQYSDIWLDEFQLLAGAGFAVLFTNPHGSTGQGEHFARAIMSPAADTPGTGWGQLDYRDLMTTVDTALARFPILDADRTGVLGGSYGGYMTAWIIAHTNRFKAACAERAAVNLVSLDWSSDVAGRFHMNHGADPMVHAAEVARMSPVSHVADIHTPLLLLHSENDLRCPPEQADSLYIPLRRLGRTVEYWRFPGEGHEMSRSGAPKHRVQRAELINEWFTRWLRP